MRRLAATLNIILFVFTCFVLLTEGPSGELLYRLFALLLLLVPVLSVVVLRPRRSGANRLAIVANLVLLASACWAIVAQYPHPAEDGIIASILLVAYMLLVVLTPVVTLIALLRTRKAQPAVV